MRPLDSVMYFWDLPQGAHCCGFTSSVPYPVKAGSSTGKRTGHMTSVVPQSPGRTQRWLPYANAVASGFSLESEALAASVGAPILFSYGDWMPPQDKEQGAWSHQCTVLCRESGGKWAEPESNHVPPDIHIPQTPFKLCLCAHNYMQVQFHPNQGFRSLYWLQFSPPHTPSFTSYRGISGSMKKGITWTNVFNTEILTLLFLPSY